MTRLADAEARELACREFVRPVALEAGAGTGKTRTLVARLGRWLLGPGWERAASELGEERGARGAAAPTRAEVAARSCEGAVAITFTDAAAAEMATRIDRLLGEAEGGGQIQDLDEPPDSVPPEELRERAGALLAASSRLRVSTIHGFCHRLLAEAPLEAGLHPAFEVDADGERTTGLATSVLLARMRGGDSALVELLSDGVAPAAVLEALVRLAAEGVAAADLEADRFDTATLRPLLADVLAALDDLLARAAPLRDLRRTPRTVAALVALHRLRDRCAECPPDAEGLAGLGGELAASAEEASPVLLRWAKAEFGAGERDALGPAAAALVAPAAEVADRLAALAALDPRGWATAARALARPLAELAARRRAEGLVSFDDLLERAARLLAERPGVRDRVRRGIRQLLVDEFQDTDRRQCDLLRRLVLDDSEAPRPGLFLVGDPKQSIYGWRSADLAAYDDFLAELREAGGVTARLEVNFRSAPPILAEVERQLVPLLVEERGIQAGYQRLLPSPRRAGDAGFVARGRAPIEFWSSLARVALAEGRATRADEAAAAEAEAFARDVRELVDAGQARYRDFALLLRARTDLDVYLDGLRRAGIPYVVQKDRSYYRRREVVDTVSALRALLDPADLLSLVAFLRSPFVGVPDGAWLPLWRAGFPAAMVGLEGERGRAETLAAIDAAASEARAAEGGATLADAWADSLAGAVEEMAALRAEFRTLPVSEWVERLRARLLLEPIAAGRFLGRFGLANLERLLADVERRLADEADPARALAALAAALAEETPAEEARPPDLDEDAVAVMTIHTAKGLQFRHVVVAQAHKQPVGRSEAEPVKIGPPAERRELRLFGRPSPGWAEVEARRRRVAAAEAARLLYVATTRAIDRLVLCGRWGSDGGTAHRRTNAAPPFAELLAPRLAGAPLPTLDEPVRRDEYGALWRLPEEAPELAPAVPPREAAAEAGAREPAGQALAARRAAARRRSLRPRFAPASALAAGAQDPGGEDERSPRLSGAGIRGQTLARVRGVALHRALEVRPLADTDLATWRDRVGAAVTAELPDAGAGEVESIVAAADDLRRSLLWRQLSLLESRRAVLARELPLVAAGERARSDDAEAPIEGYVGTLDLLYRDPDSGELVVADFKSDAVPDAVAADELAARYRPQLALYGRAVSDALALAALPRLELWLLAADRIVTLARSGGGAPESG